MKNFSINKTMTLLEALRDIYPHSSNATLRKLLKNKRVYVDNKVIVQGNHILDEKQNISIGSSAKPISHGISLIHDDKNFIVINKPKGLLSVPLDTGYSDNALEALRNHYRSTQIFPVHRIDKDTSGIIIFAKGKQSTKLLNIMFKNHDFTRVYLAVVLGHVKENKGTWTSRLVEYNDFEVQSNTSEDQGKLAITHYSVIRRSKNFSFLKLTLETGKKHQIRVHCKDAGHPIIGDKKYGSTSYDPISRMCLHSLLLEFKDPFSGKNLSFSAPIPSQFTKLGLTNFPKKSYTSEDK